MKCNYNGRFEQDMDRKKAPRVFNVDRPVIVYLLEICNTTDLILKYHLLFELTIERNSSTIALDYLPSSWPALPTSALQTKLTDNYRESWQPPWVEMLVGYPDR